MDSMYEQKRVVIKPLPPLFGGNFRNTGIGGLSVMGNGKICGPGYGIGDKQVRKGVTGWKNDSGRELLCLNGDDKNIPLIFNMWQRFARIYRCQRFHAFQSILSACAIIKE